VIAPAPLIARARSAGDIGEWRAGSGARQRVSRLCVRARSLGYAASAWAIAYAIGVRGDQGLGGTLGVAGTFDDPAAVRRASLIAGVGILLVASAPLALVRPWGLRLPRWLVIIPALAGSAYAASHALTAYVTKPLHALGVIQLQFDGWASRDEAAPVGLGSPLLRALVSRARGARHARNAALRPPLWRLRPRGPAARGHHRHGDASPDGVLLHPGPRAQRVIVRRRRRRRLVPTRLAAETGDGLIARLGRLDEGRL
jgi:hypothetical protein